MSTIGTFGVVVELLVLHHIVPVLIVYVEIDPSSSSIISESNASLHLHFLTYFVFNNFWSQSDPWLLK